MRRPLMSVAAMLGIAAALLGGCGKSSSPTAPVTATTDQAQVSATLAAASTLVDDNLAEDGSQVTAALEPARGASLETAIRPFTWWQQITGETRTWSFAWSDTDSTGHPTRVVATLMKHMTGTLVIIPASAADSTQPSSQRITKPIDKTLTRQVELQRLSLGNGRQWKVVEVTGAFVQTAGATTHLESLRLQSSSGIDTTITDPLQFFSLRHVITFGPNDTVTVTATTSRTNDFVYIHRWDWRHRLHNNGDGTYSFTWVTSAWSGWRHFGIQAISHGSIADDTAAFDMQAWHLPFRVSGGQPPVDYYP